MRKAFSFLNSYYRVYNKLKTAEQQLMFLDAILKAQSLEVKIEDLLFDDDMVDLAFESVKHSLQSSVDGYLAKVSDGGFKGAYEGGYEGASQQEKEKEEGKGKGKEEEEGKEEQTAIPYESFMKQWNLLATKITIAPIKSLSTARKNKIKTRIKNDEIFADEFHTILLEIEQSDFLKGKNPQGWKVSFDWVIHNDINFMKILEGNYRDNKGQSSSSNFIDAHFKKGDNVPKDENIIEVDPNE